MKSTTNAFFLLPIIFYSSMAFAVSPACVVNKTCVQVNVKNDSGRVMYLQIYGSETKQFFNFTTGDYNSVFDPQADLKFVANNSTETFYLPGVGIQHGGRMYISTAPMNGIPDLATDPNIYDKVEMGWSDKGTAVWNTTSVDFFGLALNMSQDKQIVGFREGTTRAQVISSLMSAMHKEPKLYTDRFFLKNKTGEVVRIFSPQHFYTDLPNAMSDTIDTSLSTLQRNFKPFNYGGNEYTDFKKLSNSSVSIKSNGQEQTITDITTGNAMAGEVKPVGNQFAGMLSAALNRGVLANEEAWGENGGHNQGFPDKYYLGPEGQYKYNTYAKVLTDFAIDKKIYATSYNDYWHMDSSLQVGSANNSPVTIHILPLQ